MSCSSNKVSKNKDFTIETHQTIGKYKRYIVVKCFEYNREGEKVRFPCTIIVDNLTFQSFNVKKKEIEDIIISPLLDKRIRIHSLFPGKESIHIKTSKLNLRDSLVVNINMVDSNVVLQ